MKKNGACQPVETAIFGGSRLLHLGLANLTRCDNGLVAHATITFSYLLLAQERRESQARGWQIHGWRRRSGLGTLSGLVDPPHVLYR